MVGLLCERILLTADGRDVKVTLSFPSQPAGFGTPERTDKCCHYVIDGLGSSHTREVWGIDSFQAVQLAMQSIGAELYSSQEAKSGNLRWSAGIVEGDLGFPVPSRLQDLLPVGLRVGQ